MTMTWGEWAAVEQFIAGFDVPLSYRAWWFVYRLWESLLLPEDVIAQLRTH